MPIHDDTLKDADDNRPVVEKTTIVERSDFLYNFEDLPREVVEDIIGHCDHLYPWLFVCKRAMKFAAHYLYQSSFPEYMDPSPEAPWGRKLKHWFLSGVEELRFSSDETTDKEYLLKAIENS
ncbi:hypothetical protein IAS59_000788 [Cryptococcus gattii]